MVGASSGYVVNHPIVLVKAKYPSLVDPTKLPLQKPPGT